MSKIGRKDSGVTDEPFNETMFPATLLESNLSTREYST